MDFTTSNSNSHSAWLTFIYPRLYIARELLKDDGVIFISIDDNEASQLKLLCDEVFGEENFVAEFIWTGKSGSEDDSHIRNNKEYILNYAKTIDSFQVGLDIKKDEKFIYFDKIQKDYYKRQLLRKWGDNSRREDRPNLYYPIIDDSGDDFYPTLPDGEDGCWRWSKETMKKAIMEGRVEFAKNGKYEAYEKIYKSEERNKTKKYKTVLQELGSSSIGTKEIKQLFNNQKIFSNPKPTILLKELCKIANANNDIILDFFAGSGTTAHAVMDLNTKDNGNRKFITVQLPELIDQKKNSTAYDFVKNTLKKTHPTIFEITKERIIRASKKIKEEIAQDITKDSNDYDLGFKIFETTPLLENSLEKMDKFDEATPKLFDPTTLTEDDFNALLTTWKVHDGMKLTDELEEITFKEYKAYYGDKKLYFVHSGFTTDDLKEFINKLDEDKLFEPNKLIVFGYTFNSKYQREISEALKSYTNKKSIEIDMIIRY